MGGALLFAVHPLAASSVAWVSEQKNLWGLLFALTSLLLFLKFETSGRRRWYALSVAAFVTALLGKTSVVMLPCLLLFYRWRRAEKLRLGDFVLTAPFFLVSLVLGLATVWFQFHKGIVDDRIPIGSYLERLYGAGYVVWFYTGKTLVPINLSMIYSAWDNAGFQPWPPTALVALLVVLWRYRRSGKWAELCWITFAAYVSILTPVLGFVPMSFMRFALVADHFQYPALPALAALAGALAAGAIESCQRQSTTNRSRMLAAACVAILPVLGVLTWQKARVYKDSLALWNDNVTTDP